MEAVSLAEKCGEHDANLCDKLTGCLEKENTINETKVGKWIRMDGVVWC